MVVNKRLSAETMLQALNSFVDESCCYACDELSGAALSEIQRLNGADFKAGEMAAMAFAEGCPPTEILEFFASVVLAAARDWKRKRTSTDNCGQTRIEAIAAVKLALSITSGEFVRGDERIDPFDANDYAMLSKREEVSILRAAYSLGAFAVDLANVGSEHDNTTAAEHVEVYSRGFVRLLAKINEESTGLHDGYDAAELLERFRGYLGKQRARTTTKKAVRT